MTERLARRLAEKRIVVIGGAGGIGSAISRTFAGHGAQILVVDIDPAGAGMCHEWEAQGLQVGFYRADVADPGEVARMANHVAASFTYVDAWVHAAGISGRPIGDGPVTECTETAWQRVLDVNLTSAYHLGRHLIPLMTRDEGGSIVFIASDDALAIPPPPHDTHAYIAAKGGLIALTKAMAISYAPRRIRVNAVAPGWIESPMTADLTEDPADRKSVV